MFPLLTIHDSHLILLLLFNIQAYANPWLASPTKWKYYFDIGNYSNNFKDDVEKYIAIEKEIKLSYKIIDEITLKTALAKDNSKTEEDKSRLEIFKNHRLETLKNYIAELKARQEYLYHDYKLLL